MFFKDRRALGLIAALALALGGGVLGAGCSGDGDGNTGGTGGTGATGGTGGEGGEGGLCGGRQCREGESCVPNGPVERCECNPDDDKCGLGRFCSPKTRRCDPIPPPPTEMESCDDFEQGERAENGLVCVGLTDGSQIWVRTCETSADCPLTHTYCQVEKDPTADAVCWYNICGRETNPESKDYNGAYYDKCDRKDAHLDVETTDFGVCNALQSGNDAIGLCESVGTSITTCVGKRFNPDPSELCAPGYRCAEPYYRLDFRCGNPGDGACAEGMSCQGGLCVHDGCKSDADCGKDGYCTSDGICAPLGTCNEVCNAGADGAAVGEHAGCSGGGTCKVAEGVSLPPSAKVRPGFCEGGTGTGGTGGGTGGDGGTGAGGDGGTGAGGTGAGGAGAGGAGAGGAGGDIAG